MKKLIIIGLIAGGLLVAGAAAAQGARGSYDEPKHDVLLTDDNFQIRKYAERIVAETTVRTSDWNNATSKGFGRLAEYIFGGNRGEDGESQKIAMTTPVESAPKGDEVVIVFTMPAKHSRDDLPKPNDERVVIRTVPPATVATLRFSGTARSTDLTALRAELAKKLEQHGYVAESEVRIAQYDPPWTPSFLRRNELMVDVKPR